MSSDAPSPAPQQLSTDGHRYSAFLAGQIETRWQQWWDEQKTYRIPNPGEPGFDAARPKFYCLDMFPYPSGAGLHVGHPEGYTATDIICRFKRMNGFNVLHPMGWDAFGLPAEQYAIQTGVHPAVTTRQAIDNFRRQLKRFGFCYDWSREFGTIDPDYYRWTQWIFLQIYHAWFDAEQQRARPIRELVEEFAGGKRRVCLNPAASEYTGAGDLPGGTRVAPWNELDADVQRMIIDSYRLAYAARQTVNWCPKLGTALANEEVIDGRSERGGFPVFRRPMRQWMFRITAYADRLLDALADVSWPESTKTQQAEWIGRSEGAEVDFPILEGALGGPPLRGGSSPAKAGDVLAAIKTQGAKALNPAGFVPRDPFPDAHRGAASDLFRFDRDLPHLRLSGATYFVTWKTVADCEFNDSERDAVLDALRHFDGDRCQVYAAVVMSNHVHWVVRPLGIHSLDEVIASVKRLSATKINRTRSRSGHIWQSEQFDRIIRDGSEFAECVQYIIENPIEARVVQNADQYAWTFVNVLAVGSQLQPAPEGRATLPLTGQSLRVFTTRPDTIFGATYMVVAPEHPLVDEAIEYPTAETDEARLREYVAWARNRSDVERMESKEKTGVFTGRCVKNPATGKPIPVWTSDYVLMGYGTGAIMAVPGHDDRDWAFAKQFDLPIVRVVEPASGTAPETNAFCEEGVAINSANEAVSLNGLPTREAKALTIKWLECKQIGTKRVNYRLRDWLFSRQRYWGEPFPIVWDARSNHHAVSEDHLPVTLPDMADYAPVESDDPQPLLAKATDWLRTTAGQVGASELDPETPVTRETNTMPGWAGSCWYYLRYCDPQNTERFVGEEAERYWMRSEQARRHEGTEARSGSTKGGVDLYIGGSEHAVLHLLYARFWHKVLFDLGYVSTDEPFGKLFHQGLILSHAYQRKDKSLVAVDAVDNVGTEESPRWVERESGEPVGEIVAKMSKSLKNVVNPDEVIAEYGADTFRLYEMYMGPLEASKPWNTRDIIGLFRFLQRAWRLCVDEGTGMVRMAGEGDAGTEKLLHRTIQRVGRDIEKLSFNTAIAAMIEFVNAASTLTSDQMDRFVRVLSPFAPHMAEEIWHRLGRQESLGSVAIQTWPPHDEAMLVDAEIEIPVQVLGKLRSKITVPADAGEDAVREAALADPRIAELIAGKTVRKVIFVPGRLVNIVAN